MTSKIRTTLMYRRRDANVLSFPKHVQSFEIGQNLLAFWCILRWPPFFNFAPRIFRCNLIRWLEYHQFFSEYVKNWRSRPFRSKFLHFTSHCAEFRLLGDLVIWWKEEVVSSLYFGVLAIWLYRLVNAQWLFVFGDFHRRCTVDRPVTTGGPKFYEGCAKLLVQEQ